MLFSATVFSRDFDGYIILKGDTVRGKVWVPMKKIIARKDEINFGDMNDQIWFSSDGSKRNGNTKKAGEITGYGFVYDETWYHFEVVDVGATYETVKPKLFAKFVKNIRFFVLRVEDGPVPVYKQYWTETQITEERSMTSGYAPQTVTGHFQHSTIYSKNKRGQFVGIPEMKTKQLKEYLKTELDLETEFLDTVNDKTKDDVDVILKKYNEWKKAQKS